MPSLKKIYVFKENKGCYCTFGNGTKKKISQRLVSEWIVSPLRVEAGCLGPQINNRKFPCMRQDKGCEFTLKMEKGRELSSSARVWEGGRTQ